MESLTDTEIRKKGLDALIKELGEIDTMRFLSQIISEKRDYLKLQDILFENMSVEEICRQSRQYYEKKHVGTSSSYTQSL